MLELNYCPSLLYQGYTTFSPQALEQLFDGQKVEHKLSFASPENEENLYDYSSLEQNISISGVQEKYSLLLENQKLVYTEKNG